MSECDVSVACSKTHTASCVKMLDVITLATLLERIKSVATVGTEENLILSAVTSIQSVSETLDTVSRSFHT